jgi:glycosyltransferase involved in cell wall biosynthesis
MDAPSDCHRLKIAQIAPLWMTVPPSTYGGTERVVHLLTEGLVRRGHDVTLYASGDSITSGHLHAIREYNLYEAYARGEFQRHELYHLANLIEAVRDSNSYDLIHCHLGSFSIPLSILSQAPLLHSMPSALQPDDLWMVHRYPDAVVTARSHSQVSCVRPDRRSTIHVIYNGCDFDSYTLSKAPGRYLAFLGRMCPQKNPVGAISIARALGLPIVLAGEAWDQDEQVYFENCVLPLVNGREVVWIGAVNDAQKNEFLRDAIALLFPIQQEEAFGNVMIEAMACGVPVVACDRGSVREVVEPGKTGFFGDGTEQLTSLVLQAMELERAVVREYARCRFSADVMVESYLRLYSSSVRVQRERFV